MVDPDVSRRMALVRSRGSEIENFARHLLSRAGVRYRLHRRDIPGCPDFYVGRLHLAIFVNGCFWHRHGCKLGSRSPKSNLTFWQPKLRRNAERDAAVTMQLERLGIERFDLWECQRRDFDSLCASVAARYHWQYEADERGRASRADGV